MSELSYPSDRPRLARRSYLAAWAVLVAGQYGVWRGGSWAYAQEKSQFVALFVLLFVLLQAAKVMPTLGRLHDLGRSPDDALWTFVPALNASLWWWLVQPTPSNTARHARMARWQSKPMLLVLFSRAFKALLKIWPALLGGLLWIGLIAGGQFVGLSWLHDLNDQSRAGLRSSFTTIGIAGVVWLLALIVRGAKARVGSWLFAWIGFDALLLAAALAVPKGLGDGGLISMSLVQVASLAMMEMLSGLAVVTWITALWARPPKPGAFAAVMATQNAKSLLMSAGYQVVIPGLMGAAAWIIAPVLAAQDPSGTPLRTAWKMARGRWGMLIRIAIFYLLVGMALQAAVLTLSGHGSLVFALSLDPNQLGLVVYILLGLCWGWMAAWITSVAVILVQPDENHLSA